MQALEVTKQFALEKPDRGPLPRCSRCGTLGAWADRRRRPVVQPFDYVFGQVIAPGRELMMIHSELLKMLVCPENHSELSVASNELVARINAAAASGTLVNKAGRKVERHLDGGLVRADQAVLYPIVEEIPMLLVDEAIPLDQPAIRS